MEVLLLWRWLFWFGLALDLILLKSKTCWRNLWKYLLRMLILNCEIKTFMQALTWTLASALFSIQLLKDMWSCSLRYLLHVLTLHQKIDNWSNLSAWLLNRIAAAVTGGSKHLRFIAWQLQSLVAPSSNSYDLWKTNSECFLPLVLWSSRTLCKHGCTFIEYIEARPRGATRSLGLYRSWGVQAPWPQAKAATRPLKLKKKTKENR